MNVVINARARFRPAKAPFHVTLEAARGALKALKAETADMPKQPYRGLQEPRDELGALMDMCAARWRWLQARNKRSVGQ